jgi:putative lipoprotein
MRRRSLGLPVAAVILAAGCGTPHVATPPPASATTVDDRGPARRGTVEAQGSDLMFRECGATESSVEKLIDPSGEVAGAVKSLATPAGRPIYVEVTGEPSGGVAAFNVSRLVRARGPHGGVLCEAPVFAGDYTASGNEPFWSVEILENGIVFHSPEEPKGTTYPYGLSPNATGTIEYATKLPSPGASTLDVIIEPGRCVDSMSGEIFGFKAHAVRNGKKLEGCAAAGVPPGGFGDAPLDELERHLGTNPVPTTWTTPPLGARLDVLLGTKAGTFRENIDVHTPIMKDGGVYYCMGNRPHRGGLDNAVFLADPASDTIAVILFVNGAREEFKEGGREVAIPEEVKKTLEHLPAP